MAHERFQPIIDAFIFDPSVPRRIARAEERFAEYIDRRHAHIQLERDSKGDPELAISVKAADDARTRAHNAAISASLDINELCELIGIDPIAPAAPEGVDPYGQDHRKKVARFAAEIVGVSDEEMKFLGLAKIKLD